MEEPEDIEPTAESSSDLRLRRWIAARPTWVKACLIAAAAVVVGYWVYAIFAISVNVIGEGLGL